jgi:hypothetical protein
MRAVQDEDRRAAIAEIERIVERALGKPPRDCEALVFVLQSLLADAWPKCRSCGATTRHVVAWRPDAESLRRDFRLAGDQIAAVLYPLCPDCASRCQQDRQEANRLDEEILHDLQEQGHIIP